MNKRAGLAALLTVVIASGAHAQQLVDVSNTRAYIVNGSIRIAELNYSYGWHVVCLLGATHRSPTATHNSKQEAVSVALSRCKMK